MLNKLGPAIRKYYFEHHASSHATKIRKALGEHWRSDPQLCSKLKNLYSGLTRIPSEPAWARTAAILQQLAKNTASHSRRRKDEALGVIVETRKHHNLEFVISNFIENTGLPVQLFHGSTNLKYIEESALQGFIKNEKLTLLNLHTENLDAGMYNALFLSREFWDSMAGGGRIFVFQTDACLCRNSEYRLEDFLGFDFIGSYCSRKRPVGLVIDGGSGGLSIRDWKLSTECLARFPAQYWPGGEDGYFAFHMELLGGHVGKQKDCSCFSTEICFSKKSFGAHQISFLPDKEKSKFFQYCPEALQLFNDRETSPESSGN